MSGGPRWWRWVAAAVATCGVLALAAVPAVLTATVGGGCDVGYQAGSVSASWVATAYGPPWGGIKGDGVTATGIDLTAGRPMLEVAVDPRVIALGSFCTCSRTRSTPAARSTPATPAARSPASTSTSTTGGDAPPRTHGGPDR